MRSACVCERERRVWEKIEIGERRERGERERKEKGG